MTTIENGSLKNDIKLLNDILEKYGKTMEEKERHDLRNLIQKLMFIERVRSKQ